MKPSPCLPWLLGPARNLQLLAAARRTSMRRAGNGLENGPAGIRLRAARTGRAHTGETTRGEHHMRKRASVLVVLLAGLLMTLAPAAFAAGPKKDNDTKVQLLAINDFHGNLQ